MTMKQVLRQAAMTLAATGLALPALAIEGGTPTTGFAAVGRGVQVTGDWVLTVQHFTLNPGALYTNGFGTRLVAAVYDAPGSGSFPANDLALMRLVSLPSAAPLMPVLGEIVPYGSFVGFDATITSAANSSGPRAYGYTSITQSLATIDPDDDGPLGQVPVNWLVSSDPAVYVQGGDSGGGLFLGHVTDTSILLGLSSDQSQDANGVPTGSGFVQPAAYRSWIDQTMLADAFDNQMIQWTTAAVPEPARWALWGTGLFGVALFARRRSARA